MKNIKLDENFVKAVKQANREIYNAKKPKDYNKNESIFNTEREKAIRKILVSAAEKAGNKTFLDIGCGTGNLLRLASDYFEKSYGVDIGENLLSAVKNDLPHAELLASDAENLPFADNSFNCVSCYAILHHLPEHEKLFNEVFRVLKKGGTLYTDHDPNYFFNRFYHVFYKIRYKNSPGFGSDKEELAEYHNTFSCGINPEKIRKTLQQIGFSDVKIEYRTSDRKKWSFLQMLIMKILKFLIKIYSAKSFYTHFSLTAVK